MPNDARDAHYADPLVYDILHSPGSDDEITAIEQIVQRRLGPTAPKTVLEPACGSGRLLELWEQKSVQVAGFDQSQAMIDFARDRCAAAAQLVVATMEEFGAEFKGHRFEVAYNLINTIRHLDSDKAMLAHFSQMHDRLSDDGIYIVGLSRSDYGGEEISEDRWHGERDGCTVTQWLQYLPPQDRSESGRFEGVISHLLAQRDGKTQQFDSSYKLRCYDHAQWVQLIGKSRLELREICDINGAVGDDDIYVLYVLGRRASLTTR